MNQGTRNLINSKPHYRENGPNQDGGIIFLSPDGARGFVKFQTQTIETDPQGNPAETGIPEIDGISAAVRKAIMPRIRRRALAARRKDARTSAKHAARTRPATAAPPRAASPSSRTPASGTWNPQGFLFADFDPNDASGKYIPDDDADTYNTPFVQHAVQRPDPADRCRRRTAIRAWTWRRSSAPIRRVMSAAALPRASPSTSSATAARRPRKSSTNTRPR